MLWLIFSLSFFPCQKINTPWPCSTEFISRMRVDDSVMLEGFKEIADAWRNKYNDPIQVKVNRATVWLLHPDTQPL